MTNQDRNQLNDVSTGKQEESMNSKDFLIGALIGGVIGAGAALLFAPKAGKELMNDINYQATAIKKRTGKLRDTAMSKGSEIANVAKEKTAAISETVTKQSSELASKVKELSGVQAVKTEKADEGDETVSESINDAYNIDGAAGTLPANDAEIRQRLEETKQAFDETELKYSSR